MSRDFSKVSPKLWRSPRFRGLEDERAKLLYLYVLTCQHQTSAGCFKLPDAYVIADLGWATEHFAVARASLVEAGLLFHDPATEEYFVPRWYRHNPGTNTNHKKGICRLISELDSDALREIAEQEYSDCHPEESNPIAASSIPNGNGSHLTNTRFLKSMGGRL